MFSCNYAFVTFVAAAAVDVAVVVAAASDAVVLTIMIMTIFLSIYHLVLILITGINAIISASLSTGRKGFLSIHNCQ